MEIIKNDDIKNIINKRLNIRKDKKKMNGEVFTPISLVCEMLDKLPLDVWKNKNYKWLDPANGIGNYPIIVYYKLMMNLDIEDHDEKSKYIIENMLFMIELDNTNYETSKNIFNMLNPNATPNIFNGSFLSDEWKKSFNTDRFDIIIGNPPYQAVTKNAISIGAGNNLYTKFIYYADMILNKNGYLLFITPPTFFSIGKSNNIYLRKEVFNNYYYHFINLEECAKYFNVGSKFIYYLIQKNNKKNKNVEIICKYNNNIYNTKLNQSLLIRDYLPYLLTYKALNILDKVKNNYNDKLSILNYSVMNKKKIFILNKIKEETNEEYKKKAFLNNFIYPIQVTGSQVVYSSKKCIYQNDKKIIMSRSGYLKPFYDDGEIGVGSDSLFIIIKDENEGNKILKLLNSKLYIFYIKINKWSGFHHKKVLQDLPNVIYDLDDINDNNIYKYFKITKEEIQFIENNL
jgi:hypothetical protein